MIMEISARLAMRMGYHRDPRYLTNISPFEGEMRRRTFAMVEAFDSLMSFQAGLPAIVHEEECDTVPPRNLFDTDFDEDCTALPLSRSPTDPTPMLYYCYKCRLGKIFRRVIRHALSPKPPPFEDALKLYCELRKTHTEVPPSLRMRALSSSFTDEPYVILTRINVELLYLKSLCVLHRTYLTHERFNPVFDSSRRTCTNAALQILNHQAELYRVYQSRGQFHNDKWMLSSIILHDFLLAAMITCLDLYESHNKSAITSPEELKAQVEQYDAMRLSHHIYASRRPFSQDARRASNVLAVMLSKVPRPSISSRAVSIPQEISRSSQVSTDEVAATEMTGDFPEGSLWDANGFDFQGKEFPLDNCASSDFNSTDPLNTMFNETDNIDWGLLDQSLLNQSNSDDFPLNW